VIFGSVPVIDVLLKTSALEMHLDYESYKKLMTAATMDSYKLIKENSILCFERRELLFDTFITQQFIQS
jgi:hypothetical protein